MTAGGGAARRSGYSRFLPAVLREPGPPGAFSLEHVLLVAEKILSGIDDDVPVVHAGGRTHTHDGIEAVLGRLHLLLDPYRAPVRFLPLLASWLGVDAMPSWDDQQLRRAVAGRVPALGLRGLHEGLLGMLDPFDIGSARPRITLDDGTRILFSTPVPGRPAGVHALVSHGPFLVSRTTAAYPGLVDPGCIAATPDGDLLVGDDGLPVTPPAVRAGLWRVSRTGAYVDTAGAPPEPRPLGPEDEQVLERPRAVAVAGPAGAWRAYVLDRNALYRTDAPGFASLARLATREDLGLAATANAMALDATGRLVVIGGVVDAEEIVVIDPGTVPPTVVVRRSLRTPGIVPGPLTTFGAHLVVADIRSQEEPDEGPGETGPADLVLLDRTDPGDWAEHRLLAALPEGSNPLITPVALAVEGPASLLVLDLGLRPVTDESGDPSLTLIAEPAAVYRVRLETPRGVGHPTATGVERVTAPGRLTRPNGMAVVDGTVYLSDPGRPVGADENPMVQNMPGHVAVQVHFARNRSAGLPTRARRTIAHDIASIVDRHSPAAVVAARPFVPTETEEEEDGDD